MSAKDCGNYVDNLDRNYEALRPRKGWPQTSSFCPPRPEPFAFYLLVRTLSHFQWQYKYLVALSPRVPGKFLAIFALLVAVWNVMVKGYWISRSLTVMNCLLGTGVGG
uniref:Uncharacterized protein n=1 Tax=Anguilla anguilla TaxID=7936 RepID=A0A0E9REK4_ANGAN